MPDSYSLDSYESILSAMTQSMIRRSNVVVQSGLTGKNKDLIGKYVNFGNIPVGMCFEIVTAYRPDINKYLKISKGYYVPFSEGVDGQYWKMGESVQVKPCEKPRMIRITKLRGR